MSDEKNKETAPNENKKVKVWGGILFFVICGAFLFDIIINRDTEDKPDVSPDKTVTQSNAAEDVSESADKKTYASILTPAQEAQSEGGYDETQSARFDKKENNNAESSDKERTPEEVAKLAQDAEVASFKLAEMTRALSATRSRWGTAKALIAVKPKSRYQKKMEGLEASRRSVNARIDKVARLKAKIMANGGTSMSSDKFTHLMGSFYSPPKNIVGYTKSNVYNASTEGKTLLQIGTVIPAITLMKTVSDYAGTFKGLVTQDIYDTRYQYILIPKGSQVIMKSMRISNVNEAISARMGITVQWIILPNGKKIDMSKSSGVDREGTGAIGDKVNRHLLAKFLGVAAYAVISSESSYSGTGQGAKSLAGNVSKGERQAAGAIAQKYLGLVPTITIRAGQSMNIITEAEIYLKPWKNLYKDYN